MADEPQNFTWNQFNLGWIPSDDAINGRKNGFLVMNNVDLDENGAVRLSHGMDLYFTVPLGFQPIKTFAVQISSGSTNYYISDNNGITFRNTVNILTAGSHTDVAFGVAFDYTLISSGIQRFKDKGDGSALVPLGLSVIGLASVSQAGYWMTYPFTTLGSTPFVGVAGTWTTPGSNFNLHCDTTPITPVNNTISAVVQSYLQTSSPVPLPLNWNIYEFNDGSSIYPTPIGGFTANPRDNDTLDLSYTWDVNNGFQYFSAITIDILLEAPGAVGAAVNNYYRATITSGPPPAYPGGLSQDLKFRRGDFVRFGSNNNLDWTTVYGYRLTLVQAAAAGSLIPTEFFIGSGIFGTGNGMAFTGSDRGVGAGVEYAVQFINNNGQYQGKSEISGSLPISLPLSFDGDNGIFDVTINKPTDTQVTEVWLFRRGNNLPEWYRVGVIPIADFVSSTYVFKDGMDDTEALTLGITVNLELSTISDITDDILEIIGPIESRWFYFTSQFIYPSDILDPDLVDTTKSVRSTAGTNEIFLWAKKIGEATILVGTSLDVYILKGTFATLPDGTLDIYYLPLSVNYPPVSRQAEYFNGNVYYLARDGWRSVNAEGISESIIGANQDLLYRGEPRYGYIPAKVQGNLTTPLFFPIGIAEGKIWCGVLDTAGGFRFEVFDIIRKYWRTFNYAAIDGGAVTCNTIQSLPDGRIMFGFSNGKVRTFPAAADTRTVEGQNQTVNLLSPVFDAGNPRNRKDSLTLKTRIYTGGSNLTLTVKADDGTTQVFTLNSATLQEVFVDLAGKVQKTYQFQLTGTIADLHLEDIQVYYEPRPDPLSRLILRPNNFGSSSKKRLRTRSLVIDTSGNDVTFTGNVDGVAAVSQIINTTIKDTVDIYYTTDVFGVDYDGLLVAAAGHEFEFYGEMADNLFVEVAPAARKFDQIGPYELFKYGRVKEFRVRLLGLGVGPSFNLPYTIYLDDNSVYTGSLTVMNGKDMTYDVPLPKGINGIVLRIEFGPAASAFCRYFAQVKILETGKDTDNRWIIIGAPSNG